MTDRVQTLLQLNADLLSRLDERAGRIGVSRSELVRDLLDQGLRDERSELRSRRLREGYERVPQASGQDAWGDLGAWSEENRRRNSAALTREEGDAW